LLFSIIIPFFNNKQTIEKCINSILYQENAFFELIIIDDFSNKDDSLYLTELINKLRENLNVEISLFHNKTNKGPSYSRNIGIQNSNGDVLIFLDADDTFTKNYLKEIEKTFLSTTASVVISSTIESKNNKIRPNYKSLHKYGYIYQINENLFGTNDFVEAFCFDPIFCGCGNIAIKKKSIKHKKFSEIDRNFEDWLFFYDVCSGIDDEIVFMTNREGILYNNENNNSLSRKTIKFKNISYPLFLNNDKIDYRFRKYLYYNWYFSSIQRSKNWFIRFFIFAKYFKYEFFKTKPVLKFYIPTLFLLFYLDPLIAFVSDQRKKIIYD
jgi:glycosyltransferase involved in cell wall biosynthesis